MNSKRKIKRRREILMGDRDRNTPQRLSRAWKREHF
jgi:hypothetical protein